MPEPDLLASSSARSGRRRRWPVRWALFCASGLIGLTAIELGVRLLTQRGRAHDATVEFRLLNRLRINVDADVPILREKEAKAHGKLGDTVRVAHPFTGYDKVLALDNVQAELERAARGEWDRAYEIVVVGGSVSQMLCEDTGDRLATIVASDPRLRGQRVRAVCFGSGGFKEPQQLMLVGWLFNLGLVPDAVINVDGFNEVALSIQDLAEGMHPLYPSRTHWSPAVARGTLTRDAVQLGAKMIAEQEAVKRWCSRALSWNLYRSAAASWLVARCIEVHRQRAQAAQRGLEGAIGTQNELVIRGPKPPPDLMTAFDVIVRSWTNGSRSLAGICAAHGVAYLHVLQPTLHDPGAKPVTDEERRVGTAGERTLAGVRRGYPLLREAAVELAAAGIAFHDASRMFEHDGRSLYIDACHLNLEGNEMLADGIAQAFLGKLPLAPAGEAPATR